MTKEFYPSKAFKKTQNEIKKTIGQIDYSKVAKKREKIKTTTPVYLQHTHKRASTYVAFDQTIRLTKGLHTKQDDNHFISK